jgi:hypothetical protein
MNNDTPKNSREDALTPSQPLQRKNLAGPSAVSILPEAGGAGNRRGSEPIGPVLARVYRFVIAANESNHEK